MKQFLEENVKPLCTAESRCQNLYSAAILWHSNPKERSKLTLIEGLAPRETTIEQIIAVGFTWDRITIYRLEDNKWVRMKVFSGFTRGSDLKVVLMGSKLFVCGGKINNDRVSDTVLRLCNVIS